MVFGWDKEMKLLTSSLHLSVKRRKPAAFDPIYIHAPAPLLFICGPMAACHVYARRKSDPSFPFLLVHLYSRCCQDTMTLIITPSRWSSHLLSRGKISHTLAYTCGTSSLVQLINSIKNSSKLRKMIWTRNYVHYLHMKIFSINKHNIFFQIFLFFDNKFLGYYKSLCEFFRYSEE